MTRSDILDEAKKTICQDRNNQYGEPEDNFKVIANFWSEYLDTEITATDVANMMILFKVARNKANSKGDNWVDICGYAACGGEIDEVTEIKTIDLNNVKTITIGDPLMLTFYDYDRYISFKHKCGELIIERAGYWISLREILRMYTEVHEDLYSAIRFDYDKTLIDVMSPDTEFGWNKLDITHMFDGECCWTVVFSKMVIRTIEKSKAETCSETYRN